MTIFMGPSSERISPLVISLKVASEGPKNNPTNTNILIVKKNPMYETNNLI